MRAHSVAVRVGPDAPVPCSVTHLARRPDCLSGERDSISLRSASFKITGCSSARPELLPWKQEAVGSNPTTLTISRMLRTIVALAPIAQLVERTAYTRRELQIGARLEVRVLLGVLSRSSVEERRSSKAGAARSNRAGTTNDITEGGAQRCATGLESRADLWVEGSTPSPSAN